MSSRNKTILVEPQEISKLKSKILRVSELAGNNFLNKIIYGGCLKALHKLPKTCVDLLILDPPYNLNKKFGKQSFAKQSVENYTAYLTKILTACLPSLKPTATVYICGDWFSSVSIYLAASQCLQVRNRITWEREKGRGAQTNYKNSSEDIWFCTVSENYTFNVDAIKLRRKVLAPYKTESGMPKDWQATTQGNFRDTFPSNLMTDFVVPFWSMPENTEHPTQKPEKLLAKLILASSNPGDLVYDPFLGSGTTAVVAKKLQRNFSGTELDLNYALVAQKRLQLAQTDSRIQGYADQVFWERNSQPPNVG